MKTIIEIINILERKGYKKLKYPVLSELKYIYSNGKFKITISHYQIKSERI